MFSPGNYHQKELFMNVGTNIQLSVFDDFIKMHNA